MKRVLFLLLAFALSLPTPLRAQDAEALTALVGVLKEVDDPAFHLDILKGISAALKGQRNIKMPKGWKEIAPQAGQEFECGGAAVGADAIADVWEQGGAGCLAEGVGGREGESGGSTKGIGGVGGGAGQGVAGGVAGVAAGESDCGGRRCGGWGRLRMPRRQRRF